MPCAMTQKQKRQYYKRKRKKQKSKRNKKAEREKQYYRHSKSTHFFKKLESAKKKGSRAVKDLYIQSQGRYYCNKCKRYHKLTSKIGKSHLGSRN